MFRVELLNGHRILAHFPGKMRIYFIRILLGNGIVVRVFLYG